ncbi:MAG: alpha-amylase family glycosyl hydrolase [Akkermansiaceae bacterium]
MEKTIRPVIYQLLIRTFGNNQSQGEVGGTIEQNGCGKFVDINESALESIAQMGFNHVWLTGVIEQASGTDYPNRPADSPDILKGRAGSPYAIRDYFDVCPDYAVDPSNRIEEFRKLLSRCHEVGLRVIIDFVPNHVARSYGSDVKPEDSFGEGDDTEVFFDYDNHFFYLDHSSQGSGPPLKLPTSHLAGCTGKFELEAAIGRVTGNNSNTWEPSIHDWYETVKLNYGHDFTKGRNTEHLPSMDAGLEEVPKTWRTMDKILCYWQEMGVDGFRADMAHMVPMEFWRWLVSRARARDPKVFFGAEAYDSDPAKLTDCDVIEELCEAGFNGAYEHPTYKILQGIYEDGKWANDLDQTIFSGDQFHQCIRYLENHDEVRIANPQHWGGWGMNVGRPAAGVMFGMSRASLMLYSGQDVGEPAIGEEGFSGDDGRTSIFDYTSMPEFQKWVNEGKYDGGRLSQKQRELRNWYVDLFAILREDAFTQGDFFGLNYFNRENPRFGRLPGETVSGHWVYAFLRSDSKRNQAFLCVVNFHPEIAMDNLSIEVPKGGLDFIGRGESDELSIIGRFGSDANWTASRSTMIAGLDIGSLVPCGVCYFELN